MALKEIVSTWYEATQLADKGRLQEATTKLHLIPEPSAKILFNLGCLYLRMKDYTRARQYFDEATQKDVYLAVGYFQSGITDALLEKVEDAAGDFTQALTVMKENKVIDYRQLGMGLTLYSFQVVYNIAVMRSRAGNHAQAQAFMSRAVRLHDEARMLPGFQGPVSLNQSGRWTLLELPHLDCLFRPARSLVANLEKRDFLGKAKVVSSVNESEDYLIPVPPVVEKPQSKSMPTSPAMPRREGERKKNIPPPPTRAPPVCPVARPPSSSRGAEDQSTSSLPSPGGPLTHAMSAENVSSRTATSPGRVRKAASSQDLVVAKLNSLFKQEAGTAGSSAGTGRAAAKPRSEFFISPPRFPQAAVPAPSPERVYVNEVVSKPKPARPPPPVIRKS